MVVIVLKIGRIESFVEDAHKLPTLAAQQESGEIRVLGFLDTDFCIRGDMEYFFGLGQLATDIEGRHDSCAAAFDSLNQAIDAMRVYQNIVVQNEHILRPF